MGYLALLLLFGPGHWGTLAWGWKEEDCEGGIHSSTSLPTGDLGPLPFRPRDGNKLTFLRLLISLCSATPLQMPTEIILHMLHFLKLPKLNVPSGPCLTQVLCKISL